MRLQSHKGNQTTLNKLQTASLLATLNPEAGDKVREADAGAWSTVARRETDGMSASGSSAMRETMAEGKEIEDECDVWAEMGHWNGLPDEFSWGHRWITKKSPMRRLQREVALRDCRRSHSPYRLAWPTVLSHCH